LKYTTAVNTGWIIGTAPVFISILSRIFLKERLGAKKIAGIGVALFGLMLLISKGSLAELSFLSSFGDLLVLASCVTWGFYTVVNRKISLTYSAVMSVFYLFVFMAVVALPFNMNAGTLHSVGNLSITGWGSVVFLGVFCSAIGYLLWAKSLAEIRTVNAAAFLYLEPFVTILGAWVFLGEPVTGFMFFSGMIIMAGVALVNF
jgi:drug/metabolite transporter (DMT)-like permease